MFKITVSYGVSTIPIESSTPITIGSIRRNPNVRGALGCGDNIKLKIGGIEMSDNETIVPNGAEVEIVTAANSKAN